MSSHIPFRPRLGRCIGKAKLKAVARLALLRAKIQKNKAKEMGVQPRPLQVHERAAAETEGSSSGPIQSSDLDVFQGLLPRDTLTLEELIKLRSALQSQARATGNGDMNFEKFKMVMTNNVKNVRHLPLDKIFHLFDFDNTEKINYQDFLLATSKLMLHGQEALRCE